MQVTAKATAEANPAIAATNTKPAKSSKGDDGQKKECRCARAKPNPATAPTNTRPLKTSRAIVALSETSVTQAKKMNPIVPTSDRTSCSRREDSEPSIDYCCVVYSNLLAVAN